MTANRKPKAAAKRGRKLTPKQERFVEEYLIDLNATQAAIRAGYSEKTADRIGAQLLGKTWVAQAVQRGKEARSKRTKITQDMVLRELARLGFSDIRKVVTWGNTELRVAPPAPGDEDGEGVVEVYHGLVLKAADEIDDDTAAAIAEVSQGKDGLKVKLYDKRATLVDIGKHIGMFIDRKEVRFGELESATDQEIARKVAQAAQQVAELEGRPVDAVLADIHGAAATPTMH
ncbi:MAG: terminase small subunit [Porticoccaceae bacterium]